MTRAKALKNFLEIFRVSSGLIRTYHLRYTKRNVSVVLIPRFVR